jgi:GT2 family glycosyltransferase
MMDVSAVVCAYTDRRWDDTHAAVASLAAQTRQPQEIILVVDHNPDLQRRLIDSLPDVRVIANAGPQGLSGGKNTGVAAAKGDLITFLDDDAIADEGWLAALRDAYDRPEVAGVGGLTLPLWNTGRPEWFPEEFDWVVGATYRGMKPGPVRNVLGGNASFRREVFDVAGGFHTGIGRSHGKPRPLGCEETEFCIRLRQARPDTIFRYEDKAVIWHRVPAERERFAYFRSRCYAEGLSKAMVTRSVGAGDGLASERRHALAVLPRGVAANLRARRLGRAGAIVAGLAATTAGYAAGAVHRR